MTDSLPKKIRRALDERNKAFENNDYLWAVMKIPNASCSEVVAMAFHKARYECTDVSKIKRLESQKWLAENNVKRMTGDPVKIGDPLPE